jgi:hypothetical protein
MTKFKISIKKLNRYQKTAETCRSFVVVGDMDTVGEAIARLRGILRGIVRL